MEISERDRGYLQQFKKNVSDVLSSNHSDIYLMKWLRAGNFNLQKCELMFREAIWIRAVYDLDTCSYNMKKPEIPEKYEFWSQLGFAKDGTPVSYVAMGNGDYKGFVYTMSTYDIFRYCSQCLETDLQRAREQSKRLGKEINEITYIIDMENFYMKKVFHTFVLEMAFDLFRMLQDQYPEVWKHLLVVNAAFYFYQAFNIVRPILRDTILQNLRVVSKENTPSLLLKYIDADELPVFLGGNRVDSRGDSMCSEFLKFGGLVPEEHYLCNKFTLQPSNTDPDVENVLIRQRSCYNYPIIVREPNSRLSIRIRTEGGSISAAVLYKAFRTDSEQVDVPSTDEYLDPHDPKCSFQLISPCVKIQTHISPGNSVCKLPKPGLYLYRFDNSCNWVTTRRVIFRIRILPPL